MFGQHHERNSHQEVWLRYQTLPWHVEGDCWKEISLYTPSCSMNATPYLARNLDKRAHSATNWLHYDAWKETGNYLFRQPSAVQYFPQLSMWTICLICTFLSLPIICIVFNVKCSTDIPTAFLPALSRKSLIECHFTPAVSTLWSKSVVVTIQPYLEYEEIEDTQQWWKIAKYAYLLQMAGGVVVVASRVFMNCG